jgi:hypothetical protein
MRYLKSIEIKLANGAGWGSWIVPLCAGFIFGGPGGVVLVATTFVANQGIKNLDYLDKHGQPPSIDWMINGN